MFSIIVSSLHLDLDVLWLTQSSEDRLQIIDGYEPETYLPGSPLEPPMRSLTAEQHPDAVQTEPFGIPNLLTGLSAALCSEVRLSPLLNTHSHWNQG